MTPSCLLLLLLSVQGLQGACLPGPRPEDRFLSHNSTSQTITVLGSHRTASRLLGSIFALLARELLGYDVQTGAAEEGLDWLDPQAQFARLSSCRQQYCTDLDSRMDSTVELRVPEALLALDLWLPAVQEVSAWGLLDAGQLGPATRFGWFISPPAGPRTHWTHWTHWRQFASPDLVTPYVLTTDQQRHIDALVSRPGGGAPYCPEPPCRHGQFVPPACRPPARCATLLTDWPSNSSLYNSSLLMEFIATNELLVRVSFLGPGLEGAVAFMANATAATNSSYLVLHYHPSALTVRHQLVPILFPLCSEPLVDARQDTHECLYTPNRLAKVAWKPIKNKAPDLWRFLDAFHFDYAEYVRLLEHYNKMVAADAGADTEDIACSWILHTHTNNEPWYKQFRGASIQEKPKLYIGGIFPINGNKFKAPELVPVAIMAMQDINNSSSILPGHELKLDIHDGECEPDVVMKRFIDFIKNKDPTRFRSTIGILGPACSDTVEPIAGVSKHYKTVVISYSAEGSISNSKSQEDFPYFFRTIAENKQYKHAYLGALTRFKWSQVATLTQEGHKYSHYIAQLQDQMQASGIVFINNRKFPRDATDMSQYLLDLRDRGAKIIIGDFYEEEARHIMCQAHHLGMTQKNGYVWFLPGWFKEHWYDVESLRRDNLTGTRLPANCSTLELQQALDGAFCLVHNNYAANTSLTVGNITVAEWRAKLKEVLAKFFKAYNEKRRPEDQNPNFDFRDGDTPNKYSGYVYDAVWLYALVLDKMINNDPSLVQDLHTNKTMTEFVSIIKQMDFTGVSGRINFHTGHSRLSEIKIMQWSLEPPGPAGQADMIVNQIGLYKPNYDNSSLPAALDIDWFEDALRWKTEDGLKPSDRDRRCGVLSPFAVMMDLECQLTITVTFLLGFGSFVVVLLSLFAGIKIRYERSMKATEERMRALGLLHSPLSVLALDDWEMPRDRVVMNRKLGEGAFGMVYGGESFFDERGWVAVAVKTLKVGSSIEDKVNFLSEADMMKRFEHRNIVKLLGVCTGTEPVYTVMEYMLYGDLKTYLLARRHLVTERNREELDEVSNKRLTSMALDIAAGLAYLAEQKYVHRDIACRNCLLNQGRTVKLADFGMTRPMFESDYYRFSRKGMLPVRWMAQESLADGLFTPASDIWSYGVLLYEIITFGSFPFQGLSNNQVLESVKAGATLPIPPGTKHQLANLLSSCWSRSPSRRPTAAEIAELLYNNPRLVSPSLDVPLASVQVERRGSLELLLGREEEVGLLPRPSSGPAVPPQGPAGPPQGPAVPPQGHTEETSLSGEDPARVLYSSQKGGCGPVAVGQGGVGSYVQPGYILMEAE